MRNVKFLLLTCFLMTSFFLTSCDDDPIPENEEELITTLSLVFTNGTETVNFTFQDLDGEGGIDGTITNGTLAANTTYNVSAVFLDETESPAENITAEVIEEDDEHQVFYQPAAGLNLDWSYSDQDANGNPLGVQTQFVTGAASTGTLTVTLIHEPDKNASGVASGDISNAGGETDIEVIFDVAIQ